MRGVTWAAVVFLLVVPAWVDTTVAGEKYKGFERGDVLMTVEELKDLMDTNDPTLLVFAVVKPVPYMIGHIPGSINVWRPDYEPKVGQPYPFDGMMLNRNEFQEFARDLGVDNDSTIVVYDEKYDATRMWWAFFLYGKSDVRVLDGGYPAWKAAGYDTDMSLTRGKGDKQGNFTAKPRRPGWVAGTDDVWRAKTSKDIQLWDAREPAEWTGAEKKGHAKQAGHIPWATFQSWTVYRVNVDGKPTGFKTAAEVQKVIDNFSMNSDKDQVFYCHSGVRTTTAIFMLYLMGWDPDRLHNYDGSWLEWSSHLSNPIATGQ